MRHLTRLIFAFAFALSACSFASADAPAAPAEDPKALVRKLGDPSFRVRGMAEKELLLRGAAALAEVQRGAEDPDLEIRRRCRSILSEIQRTDVDALTGFMAGKEDPKTPLPGWTVIRGIMGTDNTSRYLYSLLYKHERGLLEAIEKDPKSVLSQFDGRVQKLYPRFVAGKGMEQQAVTTENVAAVLVIALASDTNANSTQRLLGVLGQPGVQQSVNWSEATRRLTEKWLERKCEDAVVGQQLANLATIYGCRDLIDAKLRPSTVKLIEAAAANPADVNKVFQAINLARQLNMADLLDTKLKPAIRKSIQAAGREPVDVTRLTQIVNVAQSLGGLDNEMRESLRPALTTIIKKHAETINDFSKLYQVLNLVRQGGCQDLIEEHLHPAFRATLIKTATQGKDFMALNQAFHQAQVLGMHDEIESILKPAVESLIRTTLTQSSDANRLQQALQAAQTFQLRETLRPVAEQLIDTASREKPDINRINSIIQFARAANVPELDKIMEKKLKPLAREALIAAKEQPLNANNLFQVLHLADQLQLKEGVDLAVKASFDKSLPGHTRGQAIFHVAKNGKRDAIPLLEPLLTDTTDLGAFSFGGTQVRTQVGDVALGAMIRLSDQKFADYNFAGMRVFGNNPNVLASPIYYGVENDTVRQANQKKWRESQAAK